MKISCADQNLTQIFDQTAGLARRLLLPDAWSCKRPSVGMVVELVSIWNATSIVLVDMYSLNTAMSTFCRRGSFFVCVRAEKICCAILSQGSVSWGLTGCRRSWGVGLHRAAVSDAIEDWLLVGQASWWSSFSKESHAAVETNVTLHDFTVSCAVRPCLVGGFPPRNE